MVGRGEEFRGWTKVHSFSYNGIVKTCNMKMKKECEGGKVMAEYIDREAAIAKCREIAACEWNHRASPVSWADAYEQFAEDIEEIPAADVAPVRHGRWLDRPKNQGLKDEEIGTVGMVDGEPWSSCYCSECGEWLVASDEYAVKGNYCPNCGAKMDGGED